MKIEYSKYDFPETGQLYMTSDLEKKDVYSIYTREHYTIPAIALHVIRQLNKRNKFIDVGASNGHETIPISIFGIQTLAIEPHPENIILLNAAIYKNAINNCTIVHAAAMDREGLFDIKGDVAWGMMQPLAKGSLGIPGATLDQLAQIYDFADAKLIKIDVEGGEILVLSGMENLLESNHPEIIIEGYILGCGERGYSVKDILKKLDSYGYDLYRFYRGLLVPITADTQQVNMVVDYLATNKSRKKLIKKFEVRAMTNEELVESQLSEAEFSEDNSAFFLKIFNMLPVDVRSNSKMKAMKKKLSAIDTSKINEAFRTGL